MTTSKRIYGKWAGNPNGTPEDESRCIKEVMTPDGFCLFHQCFRERGCGPGGLYCMQHAKKIRSRKISCEDKRGRRETE